eukprot:g1507.t1
MRRSALGRTLATLAGSHGAELDASATSQLKSLRDIVMGRTSGDVSIFENAGIGGLDETLRGLFQRTFASRMLPPEAIQKLKLQHTKGVLLYGAPGTGKTLCARQIGHILGARTPRYINGPEIFSSKVGESEETIRKIFEPSEREWRKKGDFSALHVLIFDEIDAVCRRRSGLGAASANSGRSRVHDNVVNQLLTKLDGLSRQNNVLVIGVTNRKDLLDDAMLRPGRLEVQVELSLPSSEGRLQILKIHTRELMESGMMSADLDLSTVASRCSGFTGAEIEGLVRTALSFALADQQSRISSINQVHVGEGDNAEDDVAEKDEDDEESVLKFLEGQLQTQVTVEHFEKALGAVERPAAQGGKQGALVSERMSSKHLFIHRGSSAYLNAVKKAELQARSCLDRAKDPSRASSIASLLLTGADGSGRTTLIEDMVSRMHFDFIRMLRPQSYVGKPYHARIDALVECFADACRSETALLVLDDLEYLGSREAHGQVEETLRILMQSNPEQESQVLVCGICDTSLAAPSVMQAFGASVRVPAVERSELVPYAEALGMPASDVALLPSDLPIGRALHLLDSAARIGSMEEAIFAASIEPSGHMGE